MASQYSSPLEIISIDEVLPSWPWAAEAPSHLSPSPSTSSEIGSRTGNWISRQPSPASQKSILLTCGSQGNYMSNDGDHRKEEPIYEQSTVWNRLSIRWWLLWTKHVQSLCSRIGTCWWWECCFISLNLRWPYAVDRTLKSNYYPHAPSVSFTWRYQPAWSMTTGAQSHKPLSANGSL